MALMALARCSVGRVRVGGALAMFLALGASLTPVPCARLAAESTPEPVTGEHVKVSPYELVQRPDRAVQRELTGGSSLPNTGRR